MYIQRAMNQLRKTVKRMRRQRRIRKRRKKICEFEKERRYVVGAHEFSN